MTYQAASGAGAAKMLELVKQMSCVTDPDARKLRPKTRWKWIAW